MQLPFNIDLKDEIIAVTGGGGVLMGAFSEALAKCGARIAILDYNEESAKALLKKLSTRAEKQSPSRQIALTKKALKTQTAKLSRHTET